MKRRELLRTLAVAGGAVVLGRELRAAEPQVRTESAGGESMGVLIDTTRCIGCRMCEWACAQANGLPEPEDGASNGQRTTSPGQWTVVNSRETGGATVTVKTQCMHCLQPACVSACLTRAMHRTPEGAVVWDGDRCMGCRYCMISCPFDVPKFEYDSANPRIRKCEMCWGRLRDGGKPACVENCPAGALQFGRRSELLTIARRRIASEPDRYIEHIYGEHEVGGTSILYLASVPFERLGLPGDVGETAYPVFTKEFLYAVPLVLTLLPPLLLAMSRATRAAEETAATVEE